MVAPPSSPHPPPPPPPPSSTVWVAHFQSSSHISANSSLGELVDRLSSFSPHSGSSGSIFAALLAWIVIGQFNDSIHGQVGGLTIQAWRVYVILCTFPCLSAAFCMVFMPESPSFLYSVSLIPNLPTPLRLHSVWSPFHTCPTSEGLEPRPGVLSGPGSRSEAFWSGTENGPRRMSPLSTQKGKLRRTAKALRRVQLVNAWCRGSKVS